jgi:hypothetical protein
MSISARVACPNSELLQAIDFVITKDGAARDEYDGLLGASVDLAAKTEGETPPGKELRNAFEVFAGAFVYADKSRTVKA